MATAAAAAAPHKLHAADAKQAAPHAVEAKRAEVQPPPQPRPRRSAPDGGAGAYIGVSTHTSVSNATLNSHNQINTTHITLNV